VSGFRSHRPVLATKGDVLLELRGAFEEARATSPIYKAREIAETINDNFEFADQLTDALRLDALTAMARSVVQEERARRSNNAYHDSEAKARANGTAEFPGFEEICRRCPTIYALPGEDDPIDTRYVETFDYDFAALPKGFNALLGHAEATLRNGRALQALWRLCRRLGGMPGETPRQILSRHGFDPAGTAGPKQT
jgi:hypothetical protein